MGNEDIKRPVIGYDEWGGSKYYDSIHEASIDTGVPPSAISRCCQGVYGSSYGYSFEYYEEDSEIECENFKKHNIEAWRREKRKHVGSDKTIVAVDIRTNKFRLYDSFRYMCKELMLDERNAYRVLSHSRYHKSVGGYALYRYDEVDLKVFDGRF